MTGTTPPDWDLVEQLFVEERGMSRRKAKAAVYTALREWRRARTAEKRQERTRTGDHPIG